MKTSLINKKSIIAAGILAVLLVIGTGVYLYLKTPVHLLAIDVNPSIELRTDRLNRVVSVNPVNEDAVNLMAGYQLDDRDLETVIGDIVDRMIFYGYLTSDRKNQILITADDTYTSAEILGQVNTAIADYMSERQLEVEILQQQLAADSLAVDAAHANNVSFGKMAIINELMANGSTMTADELAGLSIRDLVAYAEARGVSLEDLIDNYKDILAEQADTVAEADTVTDANTASEVDAVSSATTKETANNTGDIISKAVESAIGTGDAQSVSVEDMEDEDEDSISGRDSDEDAYEDAEDNDDGQEDDAKEHKERSRKNHESAYQASESDAEEENSDADYEDAADEDNDYDVEDSDRDEDTSEHEDAYYEDSEDNDSQGNEDEDSYYEEDREDEDGNWNNDRYSDDQGGEYDRNSGDEDHQGDED